MEHNLVLQAAKFASDKHRDQRRKDANLSPYMNHLIDVAHLLCEVAAVEDPEIRLPPYCTIPWRIPTRLTMNLNRNLGRGSSV